MEDLRSYKQRGTPDCPIALHYFRPGRNKDPYLRRQPELEFIIVEDGELDYRLEEQVLTMFAGDVMVIAPEKTHGLVKKTRGTRFYILSVATEAIAMPAEHAFQKEFVQPLENGLLQPPTLVQSGHPAYEAAQAAVKKLPKAMMDQPNYKLHRYLAAVELCVAIAPWCVRAEAGIRDSLPENPAVRQAMLYIHNKYDRPLDLKAIAKHVHLHPNYLCSLFKAQTGQTVLQYLTKKRVDAAIYLLHDSNLPVEVIAEKTGFGSRCLFFRHFRSLTGTTPHAYRKQHLQAEE